MRQDDTTAVWQDGKSAIRQYGNTAIQKIVLKNIAGLPGLELNVKSTFNHSRRNARCCTAARLALIFVSH
jgi:hypothetical protein